MGFSSINLKEIFKLSHSKRCHVMTKGDVNVGIADIEIGILSSDKIKSELFINTVVFNNNLIVMM